MRAILFLITIPVLYSLPSFAQTPTPVPRTVADVAERLGNRSAEPAPFKQYRGVLVASAPADSTHDALVDFHLRRADAAANLGFVAQTLQERRRLVELTEGRRNQAKHLIDLAIAEMTAGNWTDAERHARRAAALPSGWWGQDVLAMILLARMQSWLGDITAARTQTDRAEALFRRVSNHSTAVQFYELVNAMFAWSRGDLQLVEGKPIAGEGSFVAAAKHALADTSVAEDRARRIDWAPAPVSTWQLLDLIEAHLARAHIQQEHLVDAEQIARKMLLRNLDKRGRDAPSTAVSLAVLGEVLVAQQRWREAAAMAEIAARILERAGAKVTSGYAFQAERVRIDSAIGVRDWQRAVELLDHMRSRMDGEPTMLRATERRGVWALALARQGRAPEAADWLGRLIRDQERVYGSDRYETAESRGFLGAALFAQDRVQEAFDALVSAVPTLLSPTRFGASGGEDGLRRLSRQAILETWIELLYAVQSNSKIDRKGVDVVAESFRAAEALRGGSLQTAVASSAARAMAVAPQLGDLIRQEQDGKREIVSLNDRLGGLALEPDSDARDKTVNALRERIGVLETERATLLGTIETRFPAYSNLIRPQAPTLEETRAVLRPGEAHVNIFSGEMATFVWAFKAEGPVSFAMTRLGREELTHRVKALRMALDPGDTDLIRGIPDFDVGAAYRLYADVLLPVSSGWSGANHLLVVTNDALGHLPLAVLPTAQVTLVRDASVPYRQFSSVPWLVLQTAFTQLPSANILVTLRRLPRPGGVRGAFIGFGDPQFALGQTGEGSGVRGLRDLRIPRVDQRDIDLARPVAWLDYSRIPRLPDTRDEILAMAKALNADPERDVFLGREASRANVKKLDLSKRRIIAFATHGLMAGDIPGVDEPSLALANPGDGKHGLLTLEDILGLKLDADWVVLSACNTAAGDSRDADALSGLVRGFFYAGSRALLVTHWPVETVSARLLVTEIFQRQAADARLSGAEALRQSMLALMGKQSAPTGGYSYSHPIFWAPYALVGDGGS